MRIGQALDDAIAVLMRETAARIILPRYQQLERHQIEEKGPDDLVTVADRESEVMLAEGLARLLPEAGIVGEEACAADPALADQLGSGLFWIIDPIDGTHNFAHGHPHFAIMIGLVGGGQALGGWIYDPLRQRLCSVRAGEGAWIDGERVVARASGKALPVAAISTRFIPEPERSRLEARVADRLMLADIPLCAGEQYPRVVLGENDIALYHRTLAWDHVPGVLFLEEAGGKAARPDGAPYHFADNASGLIAAGSPAMWDVAANILNGPD